MVNLICERFIYGWRISLSIQILVGFSLAFGMLFLPETPRYMCMHFEFNSSMFFIVTSYLSTRWLVKKHRDLKAAKVLARIHQTAEKNVEEEIDAIRATVVKDEKQHVWHVLKLLFTWKCLHRFVSHVTLQLRITKFLAFQAHRLKFCTFITAGYSLEWVYRFSSELWVPRQYCKSEQFQISMICLCIIHLAGMNVQHFIIKVSN